MDPQEFALRRMVLLRRYENTITREVATLLARVRQQLVALLATQDLTAVSPGRQAARLESIVRKANDIIADAYRELNTLTKSRLVDVAGVQIKLTESELKRLGRLGGLELSALRVPTRAQMWSIITTDPVRGAVMGDWWKSQSLALRRAFRTQVQIGLTQNEPLGDLIRRVRGTSIGSGRFAGGIMDTTTRNAAALVRTAVNEISNRAAYESYAANSDVTQQFEYVATLDDRTTELCAGLDGQVFRYDDPRAPVPPMHWNCRSTIVPVINYAGLGATAPKEEPRQTWGDWFKEQSVATQADILGPSRAAMVRSGSVSVAELVRRDGSRATLSELESLARS